MATDTTESTEQADLSAEADLLQRITEKQREVDQAKLRYESLKVDTKEAKDEWEVMVDQLGGIIRRGTEQLPLFDQKPKEEGEPAWRSAPIDLLELPKNIVNALEQQGIELIGQLEDQRCDAAGLTAVPGIGEGKATIIIDKIITWINANRDTYEAPVEGEPVHWRDEPINVLPGCPMPVLEALAKHDLLTLGNVFDFIQEHGNVGVDSLRGMGTERGESLRAAIGRYRDANPEKFEAVEA